MRLVLVHGRAQGEKQQADISAAWLEALQRGLHTSALPPLPTALDIRLPFYGSRLDELTDEGPAPGEVVARGTGDTANPMQGQFVWDLAQRAGVTDEEIAAEAGEELVERGPQNWAWVHAAARVLSRKVPWLGTFLLPRLTADVAAYMTLPHITAEINKIVAAELEGPAVVVGHSLGSIVAYWVLRKDRPDVKVPLFVTVGCPLGIDVVKKYLPRPLGQPAGVKRWVNAADKRDPVALYSRLDRDHFPADIENADDVHNPEDNPHGIAGYLSDSYICRRISEALHAT